MTCLTDQGLVACIIAYSYCTLWLAAEYPIQFFGGLIYSEPVDCDGRFEYLVVAANLKWNLLACTHIQIKSQLCTSMVPHLICVRRKPVVRLEMFKSSSN